MNLPFAIVNCGSNQSWEVLIREKTVILEKLEVAPVDALPWQVHAILTLQPNKTFSRYET